MSKASSIDLISPGRRNFLISSGAGVGAFSLGFSILGTAQSNQSNEPQEINAWIVIDPDETVTIRVARIEMGQGSLTGLLQLVVEELECDWDRVVFDTVTPHENLVRDNVWGDQSTGGSRAIRQSQEKLLRAGATARSMLITAAARTWNVPDNECSVSRGIIVHGPSGRQLTYGTIARVAQTLMPPSKVNLKDPKDWHTVGKPLRRKDTLDKLDGSLKFSVDVQLPGMLIAIPKSCPVHGGKLVGFDEKKVSQMPGVTKVVRVDEATVAVIADSFWNAKKALESLPIDWDEGEGKNVSSAEIDSNLKKGLSQDGAYVGNQIGVAKEVLSTRSRLIESDYSYPYLSHAQMEPLSATAIWTSDKCEIWTATQVPEMALATASEVSGLPKSACRINPVRIGGSFGRRLTTEYIASSINIAKQIPGVPVKMMYTREEDMTQGRYHPATRCRMRAALKPDGRIEALHMRLSGPSILASIRPNVSIENGDPVTYQGVEPAGKQHALGYGIDNLLVDHAMINQHVRPGAWRGVNLNQNAIYLECFIDELAKTAGVDPLIYRLNMLEESSKNRKVLEAAARGIGWNSRKIKGRHRGIAQIAGFGSYVAAAAEVSVTGDHLEIHRIVAATDPGYIVNPQQVEAQVTGSFVASLSHLLKGGLTITNGRVDQDNYDTFQLLRINETPKIEVIQVPSGGFWGGVGEPTIAVAAPAVLNAVYAATGRMFRDVPLNLNA